MSDQTTNENIIELIRSETENHWEKNHYPILFSQLGYLLKTNFQANDLPSILGGKKLNLWLQQNSAAAKVKIVKHPEQKEKIGIIPANENYTYELTNLASKAAPKKRKNANQDTIINFLFALSKLPKEDLEKVVIPVSVLTKMIAGEK